MNRDQMIMWLDARYFKICREFPAFNCNVPLAQYIAANLPHMVQSEYWRLREWER